MVCCVTCCIFLYSIVHSFVHTVHTDPLRHRGFWYTPFLHFAGKLLIIENSKDGIEYYVCLFESLYTIDLFNFFSLMFVYAYYMLDDLQYI